MECGVECGVECGEECGVEWGLKYSCYSLACPQLLIGCEACDCLKYKSGNLPETIQQLEGTGHTTAGL